MLAGLVLERGKHAVKGRLCDSDGGLEGHEITGQGHGGVGDASSSQPGRDGLDGGVSGGNELGELVHGQVLVEEGVARGGNAPEDLVKKIGVADLEGHSQRDGGISIGSTDPMPVAGIFL